MRATFLKFSLMALALSMSAPQTATATHRLQTTQQVRTVRGSVIDAADNQPVIGASIVLSGTSIGTITDVDGKFTIKAVGKNPKLVISYIGKKTVEMSVPESGVVSVKLENADDLLDEVVVVGAGTQKKVSVTGAITSIKGSQLAVPSSSLSTAFAGRIAGVVARQNSGEPGSGAEFYIRGIGTFGGRATPLILLDDVEVSAPDLNYVPAENIESFSILKDASATAIYGARGANGVMIVTTKGGDYNSKTRLNMTVENSFNYIDQFPKFVDGARYMEMYNEAARGSGQAERYTALEIERTRTGYNPLVYPDVNWKDMMFKNMSMRQAVNVNVSGGGSKMKYYMSLNMTHDSGLINTKKAYSWDNNINIVNYTFQNNLSYKLTPTTTIQMNMNAQIRNTKSPNVTSRDLFNLILTTNPIQFPATYPAIPDDPMYDHILYGNDYITGNVMYINPYERMMTSFKEMDQNILNTVIKIDQNLDFITHGLNFNAWVNFKNFAGSSYHRSITGHNYRIKAGSYDAENPESPYELELLNTDGTDFISQSNISKWGDQTIEMQANLNWNRRFGKHSVGAMALYRQREYRNEVLPNRNQGISARLTYDYDTRYLLEFNAGYNGTERLAKEDRFGFFPAVSAGWVMSNETFFKPLKKIITHLKLRGSYGIVGSDDLAKPSGSYYLFIDKIADNNLSKLQWQFGQDGEIKGGGPMLTYYAMKGLGWEKVKKLDLGLDLHLLNCLELTFDYFLDKRYDIFMHREAWPQSLAYHVAKPWSNIGKMNNEGFEVSLRYNRRFSKDFSASIQGNLTYNQNKVIYKDEPIYPTVWKTAINKPYGKIMGYVAEGLFRSQEEIDNSPKQNLGSVVRVGDIKYRDINGDGKITDDDQMMISQYNGTPHLQYGFGGTIEYKKFDFGIFFTGSALRKIMTNGMDPFQEGVGVGNRNVVQYIADDYWSEEKQNWNASYPRLGLKTTDIANNTKPSTYWLRDGSFMRLKNVELGWSFKYGRIYVSGANLLTLTSFKLWDPELSGWNAYPMQKTVNVGLQLHI